MKGWHLQLLFWAYRLHRGRFAEGLLKVLRKVLLMTCDFLFWIDSQFHDALQVHCSLPSLLSSLLSLSISLKQGLCSGTSFVRKRLLSESVAYFVIFRYDFFRTLAEGLRKIRECFFVAQACNHVFRSHLCRICASTVQGNLSLTARGLLHLTTPASNLQ